MDLSKKEGVRGLEEMMKLLRSTENKKDNRD